MARIRTGWFLERIPYARLGDAQPPVLVVDGGQGFVRRPDPRRSARDLRRVAKLLPAGSRFVLLGYDPRPPVGVSASDVADDVAAIIRREWGRPMTLMGISYGGLVAARVAARHPELVDRLILVASAHRFSPEGEERVRRQIALLERRDLAGFLDEFAGVFRRSWLNALVRLRVRMSRRRMILGLNEPEAIVRYLRATLDGDPVRPEAITASTLVTGGSEDQFFGDGAMREVAAGVPNARLELLAGETHMAPVERARDVASAVERFLSS